jgi:hypothetical protein
MGEVGARARPRREIPWRRNLSRRLAQPALGHGRVQVMVRRAFIMADRDALSTSELKAFVYVRRQYRDGRVDRELCRSIRRVPSGGPGIIP